MTFSPRLAPRLFWAGACILALSGALGACAHKDKPPMMAEGPGPGGPPPPPAYGDRGPSTAGTGAVSSNPYGGAYRPGSPEEFAARDGDRVFFDYDQYTIRPDGRAVLDAQAAWLTKWPSVTIRVEGNADERGTREYNFSLAGRRASAVRQYLSEKGINPARMETISYGKERPLDTSGTEEGMARNRNAHTAIVGGAR